MSLPKETMEILEALAPELKESEDERIREWLIDYFARIGKSWIHREFTCEQIIAYLEKQPEVDLEKELDQWRHKHFAGKRDGHYSGEYLERSSQLDIVRHFYELGKNAR